MIFWMFSIRDLFFALRSASKVVSLERNCLSSLLMSNTKFLTAYNTESEAPVPLSFVVSLRPRFTLSRPNSSRMFSLSFSDKTLIGGLLGGGIISLFWLFSEGVGLVNLILPKFWRRLSSSFLLILVSMFLSAS